ncbi:30S ribosomal protein S3 [Candidatus Peregrinibacteria bacterium]|jgi:small subunit ribosomal protein S3|nr:30S ribosomal protein S3 [Candidatus Peregrinibacteria bacterium]MBT4147769.1 30S ribosomal protein S3 [Candidatus Peregrinibacteria bacterium]MBT4365920.1 30S ribosomal protein S3 [Candidatus Peregrinibacteria bacterium]MBT4456545.1 30S ribosomal protein S3 [Candidatus Peregrinibacteria bacterium]
MGQKVNPKVIRIGITRDWDSRWYAGKKEYAKLLHQDLEIEKAIRAKLTEGGISKIEILRTQGKVITNIYTSKPGIIIGRGGSVIEDLRTLLEKKFKVTIAINIKEIKKPMIDAGTVAESIAQQVVKRVSYRRACKMAIEKAMETGAKGAKIKVAGRLNGVEIAREEFFSLGKIPLHTFRADIDYATATAQTTYGAIGIKVWIYKGEIFKKDLDSRLQNEIEEIKNT